MLLVKFNNIYTIDFERKVLWLLPTFLRKIGQYQWLISLLEPLRVLHQDFLMYRRLSNYKLKHNSQVCYLQKVLNDAFDSEQKRIYITNGRFIQPLYIYTTAEDRPVYLGSEFIYSESDLSAGFEDFTVHIPIDIKPNNNTALEGLIADMKALINYYKLAAKTYNLRWIN